MGFVRYRTLPWMVCRDLNKGRFARLLVPSDKAMSARWMLVPAATALALSLGGCEKSPAQEALARCERAGDMYVAARSELGAAIDHYNATFSSLLQKAEMKRGVPALELAQEEAVAHWRDSPNDQAWSTYRRQQDAVSDARVAATKDAEDATLALRQDIRDKEWRMGMEQRMLSRMIEEALAAREPGVPLCSWRKGASWESEAAVECRRYRDPVCSWQFE